MKCFLIHILGFLGLSSCFLHNPLKLYKFDHPSEILKQYATSTETIEKPVSLLTDKLETVTEDIKRIQKKSTASIVFIAGFETFNVALYRKAASQVMAQVPAVSISVFTDVDITEKPDVVEKALLSADVLFASLLFDYNSILWIRRRIDHIPTRFCFESALELMKETSVGSFKMAGGSSGSGPPAPVKAILKQFGSGKEEDALAGYLNFLKIGPSLLKWLPGDKVKDLRTWLTVYSYWNQGNIDNVVSMFLVIIRDLKLVPDASTLKPDEVKETPPTGLLHPDLRGYVNTPREYVAWYEKTHPWVTEKTPRVALLLYRKHVVTGQEYIAQLIRLLEEEGVMPVPIFINGVEAHTVVREQLTSHFEQSERQRGNIALPSLGEDCARVDAVVNTIGFPLVGGPAGSMEGGRQADVAREILSAKNIPYLVAAPLLIQDVNSWKQLGVQGLQTVVLYSLPELDGAVEPVVLGGLNGENIELLPERVRRLTGRLKAWVRLRQAAAYDRKVAVIVYGFPPNVGAVATAALLDVGESLRTVLVRMKEEGYDLGDCNPGQWRGDDIVAAIRAINAEGAGEGGILRAQRSLGSKGSGFGALRFLPGTEIGGAEVTPQELRQWLGPDMTAKMEKQWGDLETYRNPGLGTTSKGNLMVIGLRIGKVFVGVQPLLGVEGDPMRLLFQRDLTPHPQYAAFYLWLHNTAKADVTLHFGMHGTVEWLPGNPLGNTEDTWPDKLMGDCPNMYMYACNNPSESLLAKRRGYATIISHNVPPYSRAGLYQQLKAVRDALSDYRSEPMRARDSIPIIVATVDRAGLFDDLPFNLDYTNDTSGSLSQERVQSLLTSTNQTLVDSFLNEFASYSTRLWEYLFELENRLFSSGLHRFGQENSPDMIRGYLEAVVGGDSGLSNTTMEAIADMAAEGTPSSAILLKAREIQNVYDREHRLQQLQHGQGYSRPFRFRWGFEEALEKAAMHKNGVDYSDLFTAEDKFAFSLLGSAGVMDFLEFQVLRVQRDWGVAGAEEKLTQLVNIASKPKKTSKTGIGAGGDGRERLGLAVDLAQLLHTNGEKELDSLLRGMAGEYVPAASGGDIIRDGTSVLPTGRNIHALDPYRLPSELSLVRGKEAASLIIQAHRDAHDGAYPETVAVTLWGLDTIKTKGESVAIVLGLVGAKPLREGTGRVVGFELIPLEELGRPRVDVLGSLSGIFRDSFGNVLDLLDDLFQRASETDEPLDMNCIRKHTLDLRAQGVERPSSRLFSNPPGDFGSMVNEKVGTGEWEDGEQLGSTWESRNAWSYGRGGEKGAARPQLLKTLLKSTDRIVQEIDSVEYGLTDIQEYYANTGALKKAAENNRGGKRVSVSVVEAFEKKIKPRDLEETLRIEYRSKLLNPRWAESMAAQGAGGAYEISQRMTAMIGWAGTAGFAEDWVFDGAAETYALDEEMARLLRSKNPEAFRNIIRRMLEAKGRGMWTPDESVLAKLQDLFDESVLAKLQDLFDEVEDEIEGV
eukprot:gene983-1922_t